MSTRAQRRRQPVPALAARPQAWWDRTAARAALFFVAALIAYFPALRGTFIWDDKMYFFDPIVRRPDALLQFWINRGQIDYLPLTFTSFWVQWHAWSGNPIGFHLVSILLHAAGAFLAWRLLARLRVPGAYAAALLFVVHPVTVEAVAWIAEQKTLLSFALALLALMLYLDFDERGGQWRYGGALALFFLAVAAKPAAVTLPVILLLALWWRHRALRRTDLLRVIPFFVVSALSSAVTIYFQQKVIAGRHIPLDGPGGRAAQIIKGIWFYLGQAVAPHGFIFFYPHWARPNFDVAAWVGLGALLAIVAVAFIFRHTWGRALLFALGCFLAATLPILGLVDMTWIEFAPVADHYLYFALISILALPTAAAAVLLRRGPRLQRFAPAAVLVIAAIFATMTRRQAHNYRDEATLWQVTLDRNPLAWQAENGLGMLRLDAADYPGALAHFQRAVAINPDYAALRTNYGVALQHQGEFEAAAEQYQAALRISPAVVQTHYNLGLIRLAQSRFAEAQSEFTGTVQLDPQFLPGELKLGQTLQLQSRFADAAAHYARALQLDPKRAETHELLAQCLQAQGRQAEALAQHREAMLLQGKALP